jgi:hypothetical protein
MASWGSEESPMKNLHSSDIILIYTYTFPSFLPGLRDHCSPKSLLWRVHNSNQWRFLSWFHRNDASRVVEVRVISEQWPAGGPKKVWDTTLHNNKNTSISYSYLDTVILRSHWENVDRWRFHRNDASRVVEVRVISEQWPAGGPKKVQWAPDLGQSDSDFHNSGGIVSMKSA